MHFPSSLEKLNQPNKHTGKGTYTNKHPPPDLISAVSRGSQHVGPLLFDASGHSEEESFRDLLDEQSEIGW